MSWSSSPWNFESNGPAAYVNYNTPTGTTFALREVHGLMQWQAHQEMHETIGTYRRSGGTLTGGTYAIQPSSPTDADNTPGFDAAVLADEDCPTTVPAWTQGGYTQMRIAAGGAAAFRTAQPRMVQNGTTYPLINNPTTGAETETVNGRYFNCWQILVPVTSDAGSQSYRVLILQPQAAYATLGEAQSEQFAAQSLGTLASISPEYFAYAKITFRTSSSYTGATGRCRIEAVAYLTGSRSGSTTTATGIWEPYLGLPAADGYALVSTAAGARSWEGVVKLAGDQTVAGAKTFTSDLRIEGTAPKLIVYGSDRSTGSRRWQFTTVAGDFFSLQSTADDGSSPVNIWYCDVFGVMRFGGAYFSGSAAFGGGPAVASSEGVTGAVQTHGLNANNSTINLGRWDNTLNAARLIFSKGRSGTAGSSSSGAASNDDRVINIIGEACDGDSMVIGCSIRAHVDETPTNGVVPMRWEFSTQNAAGSFDVRAIIHASGGVSLASSTDPGVGNLAASAMSLAGGTVSTTGNIVAMSSANGFARLTGAAPVVQGIVAPSAGCQLLYLYCANAVTLKHEDASATAANRIFSSTGADISVSAGKTVHLIYDNASLRWRDVRF
jgi:hypothetical protein